MKSFILFIYNLIYLETLTVDRMHEIWEMKNNAKHVENAMQAFMLSEIPCSSCKQVGYTNSIIYDLPQFLILKTRSNVDECITLVDDVNRLTIRPTVSHTPIEYNIQTVMLVLEEDSIVYLRKSQNGYTSYNEASNQFELINNVSSEDAGLASKWTIFIYETFDASSNFSLQTIDLDRTELPSAIEPQHHIIDTVKDLLSLYKKSINVHSITIGSTDIKILLEKNGDINDLIIDAHLSITASNISSTQNVLALPSYIIRQIISKTLKHLPIPWLNYDILLCPINQNHHWYIIIIDIKRKLILELDSLVTHDIPRTQNLNRLLHILTLQYYLKMNKEINFLTDWRLFSFRSYNNMQQTDAHSCGINLLIRTEAYINQKKFVEIKADQVQLYRYQIAETLLRYAKPPSPDSSSISSSSSVSIQTLNLTFYISINYLLDTQWNTRLPQKRTISKKNNS